MANSLTGDFDVVAEFALPAVDRVLAAMHQCERLLHSIAVRVDDNPPPGPKVNHPTAVGVVDSFGDAIADQFGGKPILPGAGAATDAVLSRLGVVLNPSDLVATEGTLTPSKLQGIAQLQLYAPTVSVPAQPDSITVTTNAMVRYFPDPGTATIAEFMRGDLHITAPMNKIASGRIHVLNIDFKAEDAVINFVPSYTSKPLSAEDMAAISLCIQNGLRTSFLPSSVTLPSSVADVQLKTLAGAVAVLLNMNSHPAAIASVTNVFLGGNDDFAFAAGRDYVFNTLRPIVDAILSQPPQHITVTFGYHFSFSVTLNSANFDLQPGNIVLTIKAHAEPRNHTWIGSADFTVTVEFFLQPSGNTVQLGVGNVSVSFDSSLTGAFAGIVDTFTGDVTSNVRTAVMDALNSANAFSIVDQMFNTDTNLANFLNAQLSQPDATPPAQPQQISLVYTAADIQQPGVVLRGLLLLRPWADPFVEYEPIAPNQSGPLNSVLGLEQDYSALKTWIPGGRVDQYEWSYQGQTGPFQVDPNKFVLALSSVVAEPGSVMARTTAIAGYSPICLTVRGTRMRNYGPGVNPQQVSARICGYRRFPVFPGGIVATIGNALPMMALTSPGPSGNVIVTGHTSAEAQSRGAVPNLLVHFADSKSLTQLKVLTDAVNGSKKASAATAIIAVIPAASLMKAPFTPGIAYSDDVDAWASLLQLRSVKAPFTAIVVPGGKIAWQKEGIPDVKSLVAALDQHLVATGSVHITMSRANVRIGQPAPNFVFEFAPGREMPLTKLRGSPATLVFWKASSRPSIDAVRALVAVSNKNGSVVLAVNDGDPEQNARAVAAESGFSEALVTDPQRFISSAYGVEIWPTTVLVNESGIIIGIQYGNSSSEQMLAASASPKR